MTAPFVGVGVLMIDPPWPKRKGGRRRVRANQGRALDYLTLPSVGAIFEMLDAQIFPLAAGTHTVFLWSVDDLLVAGEAEMLSRGYRRHARFVWDKENGVAPAFSVRYTHEYLSWFYRPRFQPIDRGQRGKFQTVLRERSREHSRKPDSAYRMVEAMYPDARRLDVFSREPRQGWEQFGDQPNYFAQVASRVDPVLAVDPSWSTPAPAVAPPSSVPSRDAGGADQ